MHISKAYLCPDGHVSESSKRCYCGNTSLVCLEKVLLERQPVVADSGYSLRVHSIIDQHVAI